ncbi:MAG: ATP-binding protein [Planctomycetaceae bacterium]|nr:ATP-binding protein [Planctomycetaceae bacterium]
MTKPLTLEDLDQFLQPQKQVDGLAGYAAAAAVLTAFDLFDLQPAGQAPVAARERLIDGLLPLCEPFTHGPEVGFWTLMLPHRRTSLRRMKSRKKMIAALAANPNRRCTTSQRMFERVLGTTAISMETLSRDELVALLTVVEWTEGILDTLPDRAAIKRAIRKNDLLAPMQRLAGSGFVGRESELEQISKFVFGPKPPEPLFVFGSGGVGKSTLLAHFILQTAVPRNAVIAYIDLDRSTVRPDQPATLQLELVNQVSWQVDISSADAVTKEITYAMSRVEEGRGLESVAASVPVPRIDDSVRRWLNGRTLLLIVDTMEEAQFLGPDVMYPLIEFLVDMHHSLAEVRLILSGRTLPDEFMQQVFPSVTGAVPSGPELPQWLEQIPRRSRPVNLTALEIEPARKLLQKSLEQGGLPQLTNAEQDEVIRLVSRNPMCLKLAARLLRDEGIEKLRAGDSEFLSRLKAEKIQALLYGRILGHIHDDDVCKLAYPGLVVRRLDPDVIREVLAGPCGLDLTQRGEHTIFSELAKEVALVENDPGDYSVRHRADVRRVMLEDLLEHVAPATVDAIDQAAIDFYKTKNGPISRAEEIYHRLRRCEEESVLNQRWVPEAAARLRSALEELPPAQRLWLAERLGVTLDERVRQAADQDAWERQAARSAERYLRSDKPESALMILRERPERLPRSPLYSLEAEACRFLKRHDDALRVAREGVESAVRAGAIDSALELLLKMVVIEEGRENPAAAEILLREAAAVASHAGNRLLQLRVEITGLRLQRALRPEDRDERAALRTRLSIQITSEILQEMRHYPVLLREAAAELGKHAPRIAAAAIQTLGVEVGTDSQAQALGRAIVDLTSSLAKEGFEALAEGAKHFEEVNYDPKEIRNWVTDIMTSRDTRKLGGEIADTAEGATTLNAFRDYFREGVADAVRGIGDATGSFRGNEGDL